MKEKILSIKASAPPRYGDRIPFDNDNKTIVKDKKGKRITLAEHKKLYPYIVANEVTWTVSTTIRDFSFTIPAGYFWNGADIPRVLWLFVGSKDSPQFKVPSMIHDFMLEYKDYIYINVLCKCMSIADFRRLSSLTFRQSLKDYGTITIKSNIMSGCVQAFQATINRNEWKIKDIHTDKVKQKK